VIKSRMAKSQPCWMWSAPEFHAFQSST